MLGPERVLVIQADPETSLDTERLENQGVKTIQVNTHASCHLNAEMVNRVLVGESLEGIKHVLIENVGNLVCPAGIRIGQHVDIVVCSTPEGWDKPHNYPHVFLDAGLVVLSKWDLSRACDFSEKEFVEGLRRVNPRAPIVKTTIRDPDSFREVASHLENERALMFKLEKKHQAFSHSRGII